MIAFLVVLFSTPRLLVKSYVSLTHTYTRQSILLYIDSSIESVAFYSSFHHERGAVNLFYVSPLPALFYIEARTYASAAHWLFHALSSPAHGAPS